MVTNSYHTLGQFQHRLESIEQRFGGIQRNVPRRKVSRFDPRRVDELQKTSMQGGDRMIAHGYSAHYAAYLQPLRDRRNLTIVELGILRGSGLALLCELFPKAKRVIGLDVDSSHYREHKSTLAALGAFKKKQPEVHEYDELAPDAADRLALILGGDKVDIFIHDALHYDQAILGTLAHAHKHFARPFVAFIEDNATVAGTLSMQYGARFTIARHGRLTVMQGDAA